MHTLLHASYNLEAINPVLIPQSIPTNQAKWQPSPALEATAPRMISSAGSWRIQGLISCPSFINAKGLLIKNHVHL